MLLIAQEMGFLKVGTISIGRTKIEANASKAKNVRCDRAGELLPISLEPPLQVEREGSQVYPRAPCALSSECDGCQYLPHRHCPMSPRPRRRGR